MKNISLVFMLAGLSSRFEGKAKAFANIGPLGENLLEYSLNQALRSNFSKIIFIVSSKTRKQIEDYFGDSFENVPIEYAMQEYDEKTRERPWGTLDALCSAKDLIEDSFIVCNGDDIYGKNSFTKLYNHLENYPEDATIGYKIGNVLSENGGVNRGMFEIKNGEVKEIIETLGITKQNMGGFKITENNLCSMNLWGLQKNTLNTLNERLIEFKKNHYDDPKIECYIPSELSYLIGEGKINVKIYETNDSWFGVTRPEDESVVREALKSL